jgi:TorA maturation chaperone TorD
MESQQYIMEERFRADSYRFLSACLCLPKRELFFQENLFKNLTHSLTRTCAEAAVFSSEMEKAFLEADEEELSVEYARLFVGPFELKAPPYGSVYLDGERRVMGNSTMEVIKLYEETGLVMDKDFKELPDHIAVELEFMYYLIYKEVEALEKSEKDKALAFEETRNHFFNRFLSPWIPPFCEKIKETTDNHFYIALADCLSIFIANQSRN